MTCLAFLDPFAILLSTDAAGYLALWALPPAREGLRCVLVSFQATGFQGISPALQYYSLHLFGTAQSSLKHRYMSHVPSTLVHGRSYGKKGRFGRPPCRLRTFNPSLKSRLGLGWRNGGTLVSPPDILHGFAPRSRFRRIFTWINKQPISDNMYGGGGAIDGEITVAVSALECQVGALPYLSPLDRNLAASETWAGATALRRLPRGAGMSHRYQPNRIVFFLLSTSRLPTIGSAHQTRKA